MKSPDNHFDKRCRSERATVLKRTKTVLLALSILTTTFSSTVVLSDEALKRGLSFVAEDRYSDARNALDPILEREPVDPRARLLHGILLVHEGRKREAIGIFYELLGDHPNMFEAHNNLAVLYAEKGRLDDARKHLHAALEHQPEATVYANLGDVYAKLASRSYERARELNFDEGSRPSESRNPNSVSLNMKGPSDSIAPVTKSTQPLASISEQQNPESAPTKAPGPASDAATIPASTCLLAGGFREREIADEAIEWLRSQGADIVDLQTSTRHIITSHRVYIPPAASRKHAMAKVSEIRKKGIHDIAIIGQGPMKYGISLGVYRNKKNVQWRVEKLKRLGYSALSLDNTIAVSEYMIEVRINDAVDELNAAWSSRFPEQSMRYVNCG